MDKLKTLDIGLENRLRYLDVVKSAVCWHGTGRYQYDSNGEVMDILRSILQDGLRGNTDFYDPTSQGDRTVSLGLNRTTSLKYADIHSPDPSLLSRNTPMGQRVSDELSRVKQRVSDSLTSGEYHDYVGSLIMGNQNWGGKYHSHGRKGELAGDIFNRGGDIKDNYPVVLGIRQGLAVIMARGLSAHEVRTNEVPVE